MKSFPTAIGHRAHPSPSYSRSDSTNREIALEHFHKAYQVSARACSKQYLRT